MLMKVWVFQHNYLVCFEITSMVLLFFDTAVGAPMIIWQRTVMFVSRKTPNNG